MKASISYLPFNNFHVVPIRELAPERLKTSAKKIKKDREKISHTSILNFIAKSFGVKGGFSAYKKVYEEELVPFLKKHDLVNQMDLCEIRNPGHGYPPKLSKQKIAERLFVSDLPVPARIFTGYDFNYADTFSDGFWYFNYRDRNERFLEDLVVPGHGLRAVIHNLKIAKANSDYVVKGHIGYSDRRLIDFVLGGYDLDISSGFNLIGDDLVSPRESESVIALYNNDLECRSYKDSLKESCLIMELFRQRIDGQDLGWVEIIPFNKNLVFLKGRDGAFDFVYRGLKDHGFQHKFMANQLKISDIPYFVSDYAFDRWYYFEYKGWLEKDSHESECHYYKMGGESSNYPGSKEVLTNYFKDQQLFSEQVRHYGTYQDGFLPVSLVEEEICISNLVSIRSFNEFLSENGEYLEYRAGDAILPINSDTDETLPVACTWFDALAYCKWYGDKNNIPVRLLSSSEYLSLREESVGFSLKESIHEHLRYIGPNNHVYLKHPPYMPEDSFQSLKVQYKKGVSEIVHDSGLVFLNSNDFAEWVSDKACIRSASLKSFYGNDNINRSSPPLDSSGKYKHLKIGFRICYDISK